MGLASEQIRQQVVHKIHTSGTSECDMDVRSARQVCEAALGAGRLPHGVYVKVMECALAGV